MAYIPSLICIKMSCLPSFASKDFQIGQSTQVSLFALNSSTCPQRSALFILSLEGTKFPSDKILSIYTEFDPEWGLAIFRSWKDQQLS